MIPKLQVGNLLCNIWYLHSIMLKVPRVPRLLVGNRLCIVLYFHSSYYAHSYQSSQGSQVTGRQSVMYFHSIMLRVTKVPRFPRLQVGNLLCIIILYFLI